MKMLQRLTGRYSVKEEPLRTELRFELLALGLFLLALVVFVVGAMRLILQSSPAPVSLSPDLLQVGAPVRYEVVPQDQRVEIAARPLFWSERRPVDLSALPVEEPEDAQVKSEILAGARLVGIFGSGESSGVILLVDGKKKRLSPGDELGGGWRLGSVEDRAAVFERGAEKEKLELRKQAIKIRVGPAATSGDPGVSGGRAHKSQGGEGEEELTFGGG